MTARPTYVRQLAAELEMLSAGSTTSWNHAGGAGVPDSRPPSGDANPPHLQMLADWDAHGDRVLGKWSDVLKDHKGCGKVRPSGKSDREIVLDAGEGFNAEDVADRFRLTPTMVRRWRTADGRHAETGRKVDAGPSNLKQRALWLVRECGYSVRAAERETGVPKSTINDSERAA